MKHFWQCNNEGTIIGAGYMSILQLFRRNQW